MTSRRRFLTTPAPALREQFEEEERKRLGDQGFEGAVAQVAKLEEQFGMADLAGFTPR